MGFGSERVAVGLLDLSSLSVRVVRRWIRCVGYRVHGNVLRVRDDSVGASFWASGRKGRHPSNLGLRSVSNAQER